MAILLACNPGKNAKQNLSKMENQLPTIGILVFDGFLTNEVVAPLDVFTRAEICGKKLFKVLLISKTNAACASDEGLRILPDITIDKCPQLDVLVVPGSNTPDKQTKDRELINFIKQQNESTQFTASHCAGAFILGEAGVANGMHIVTYCGGSAVLQKEYPTLIVQNDSVNSVVIDGKIISSNGNLVSYLASLELLEKMAGKEQREYVENELLINKLK